MLWENTTNEEVLQRARDEIRRSWRRACAENIDHPRAKELFDPEKLPAFHHPFAGGGALPLYTLCERKKRAPQALAYNALVQCWPELTKLVHTAALQSKRTQTVFDF